MKTITGSCLCGAVCFEVDDNFQQLNLCHCDQCQRATGSAHASNLFTDPGNIRWTEGKNAFCTECGSGLPYVSKTGKSLIVQAGVLNEAFASNPTVRNIFWSERADWYDATIDAEHVATFPE